MLIFKGLVDTGMLCESISYKRLELEYFKTVRAIDSFVDLKLQLHTLLQVEHGGKEHVKKLENINVSQKNNSSF